MKQVSQAVILCGGLGSRLRPHTDHIPKPMILCNGMPFLWYLCSQLSELGVKRFVLLTGYLSEKIETYFGDGSQWGWVIQYSVGPVDWPTGKRIWEAQSLIEDRFLLLYSDNIVPYPLNKVLKSHEANDLALTCMVTEKFPGNISLDEQGHVEIYDNNRSNDNLEYVEIGYMVVEKEETLAYFDNPECSFSSILETMARKKQINTWTQRDAYHSISDEKRWRLAENYLKPKKIILIDRDGVINKKAARGEYISDWKDFNWIQDTCESMKRLAKNGFQFIVISNQAGIARKMVDPIKLNEIHKNMQEECKRDGIEILAIYVCPHHWDENCQCRKPKPGLFYRASVEWSFRLDKTLFIGDDPRDCIAANNAGCKSVFIGELNELDGLSENDYPLYSSKALSESIATINQFFKIEQQSDNN